MTSSLIVIFIFLEESQPTITDAYISVTVSIMWVLLSVVSIINMTIYVEYQPISMVSNSRALRNITDNNPLHQNDDECRHQIVILVKVIHKAAPWS